MGSPLRYLRRRISTIRQRRLWRSEQSRAIQLADLPTGQRGICQKGTRCCHVPSTSKRGPRRYPMARRWWGTASIKTPQSSQILSKILLKRAETLLDVDNYPTAIKIWLTSPYTCPSHLYRTFKYPDWRRSTACLKRECLKSLISKTSPQGHVYLVIALWIKWRIKARRKPLRNHD